MSPRGSGRRRYAARTLLREQRVHLADRLLHALGGAHVEQLLHRLLGRVDRDELHSRAPVLLGEAHVHLPGGHVGIDVAVGVGEGVLDVQRPRRIDRDDAPQAVEVLALRAGHEVGDGAAGLELEPFEGRRVRRRPPPALELARVGPQRPHAFERRIELGGDGQGAAVEVLVDVDDGHWAFPSSERTSDMRSTRPRHRSSSSSSARRARATAVASVRTSVSRPRRSLATRPARSSTATCFWTAAKLIGYASASRDTDGASIAQRRRMSRRVGSARPLKSWSRLATTTWLYVSAAARGVPSVYLAGPLGVVARHEGVARRRPCEALALAESDLDRS